MRGPSWAFLCVTEPGQRRQSTQKYSCVECAGTNLECNVLKTPKFVSNGMLHAFVFHEQALGGTSVPPCLPLTYTENQCVMHPVCTSASALALCST